MRKNAFAGTLNLPRSILPNRSNRKRVPELLKKTGEELYAWQKKQFGHQKPYVLHDGPPYANGALHLGHAVNKILKDFINRYNVLAGCHVEYKPGWDCHGLPIELSSLKKHKPKTSMERRKVARELASSMIVRQMEGFKGFGVMADWNDIYRTMDTEYVVRELRVLAELARKGLVFRERKPVYWSVESATALAESELQYGERKSTAVYVAYPIKASSDKKLVIWTTTPWTLPANQAIAVNKDMNYVLTGDNLIVAESRLDTVGGSIKQYIKGSDLIGIQYLCPLRGTYHSVVAGEHVTSDTGTGLVHTAPAHGKEDFALGQQCGLATHSPVNEKGRYFGDEIPKELVGLDARTEGQSKVLELLKPAILKVESIVHSVPFDWRSKTPVMILATPQFFIDLGPFREKAIEALDNVQFRPQQGKQRLTAFVQSRTDWCISRQRVWGVPIPAFYKDGNCIFSPEIIEQVASKIEADGSALERWFDPSDSPNEWVSLDGSDWRKSQDTLDVWLDSGTSWTQLSETPAQYYLEGSDQHRGWFQSSLLTHVAVKSRPEAPFRELITHGFVLDENRQKMSKSLGNVVAPEDLIKTLGVDGLRLLIAQSDYTADISLSDTAVHQVASNVKKFRLSFKYLLGNLTDYEIQDQVELNELDKHALTNLSVLVRQCLDAYKEHRFNYVVKYLQAHMNSSLSSLYFDVAKDILYADAVDSPARRAIQYVLHTVLDVYVRLLSPLMPLLTQEVWELCPPTITKNLASPAMAGWPGEIAKFPEETKLVDRLLELRTQSNEAIELARLDKRVGSSLACDVIVPSSLQKHRALLEQLLIVSNVFMSSDPQPSFEWSYNVGDITVVPAQSHKCPRCWRFASSEEDKLCARCEDVL